jgi:D-alanyl-D-alanine endopeptidase (penicillin-binding protein 7)
MDSSRSNFYWLKIGRPLFIIAGLILTLAQPILTSADATTSATSSPSGKASWYDFKPGFFAASTIYPMGQKVRVHHIASGKTVDVVINDYGPDPKVHPDRMIDLQKEAFLKLATLGTGVITVRLEPLSAAGQTMITQPTTTTATTVSSTPAIKIIRDLTKERVALQQFTKQYARLPKTSADWQIIHNLAYLTKPTKTTSDFQKLDITNQDAASVVVLDADNNQILWQKNAQKVVPIASLTKMVAVKTFLDTKPNLDKIVSYSSQDEQEITKYCALSEAALLRLKSGDQLKIKDLVYSALIGSANNAVESLVRVSGLSRAEFIKKMNANAKKWGAINTKFVEPTGLSTDNVSTAKDYALILKAVSQDANIKKISTTAVYKFSTTNTKQSHTIKNTNKLLQDGQFSLQSSKTGYLVEAGHCLAMAAQNQNTKQKFIVVTLGSSSWSKSYATASQILTTALN